MSYDVILLANAPITMLSTRTYGPYRLASELRTKGYSVLVINHVEFLDMNTFIKILKLAVGDNTLCVGFSTSWFISATGLGDFNEYEVDYPNGDIWNLKKNGIFSLIENGIMYKFSQEETDTVIDAIKKIKPDVKVVIGGHDSHAYISKSKKIDHIFIGYSENQFPMYIDSLVNNHISNFAKIIDFDAKGLIGDFDFRNSVVSYDETDFIQKNEVLLLETTRGCIFNCSFCSYPHRGSKTKNFIRYKDSIKTELLQNYEKWGTTKYIIVDDTFNDHTEKLELIADVVKELPFSLKCWAYCRVDLIGVYPEQAQLMKDIGIKEILWGLETWDENTAKLVKKGNSNDKKIKGMRIAKEVWGDEVAIAASMVVGLPQDTRKSWDEFEKFLEEEGHLYLDGIYPGELWIRADDEFSEMRKSWNNMADIEKDPKKYGYSFPYVEQGQIHRWVRSGGDINSFEEAQELSNELNNRFEKYNSKFLSKLNEVEAINDMKSEVYPDIYDKNHGDPKWEIIHRWCHEKYFPFLINYLQEQVI